MQQKHQHENSGPRSQKSEETSADAFQDRNLVFKGGYPTEPLMQNNSGREAGSAPGQWTFVIESLKLAMTQGVSMTAGVSQLSLRDPALKGHEDAN